MYMASLGYLEVKKKKEKENYVKIIDSITLISYS